MKINSYVLLSLGLILSGNLINAESQLVKWAQQVSITNGLKAASNDIANAATNAYVALPSQEAIIKTAIVGKNYAQKLVNAGGEMIQRFPIESYSKQLVGHALLAASFGITARGIHLSTTAKDDDVDSVLAGLVFAGLGAFWSARLLIVLYQ
jgi:hypothetical protein